jgi:hypothetical protein
MDLHQAAKVVSGLDCICPTLPVKLSGVNGELKHFRQSQRFVIVRMVPEKFLARQNELLRAHGDAAGRGKRSEHGALAITIYPPSQGR